MEESKVGVTKVTLTAALKSPNKGENQGLGQLVGNQGG